LTGYAAKTLPGVQEAMEARKWQLAEQYTLITAKALDSYREQLDRLTVLLGHDPA
jgi:N-acetylated-alpha-linked acidic dipeptidase